jgi:hypothetical protein
MKIEVKFRKEGKNGLLKMAVAESNRASQIAT